MHVSPDHRAPADAGAAGRESALRSVVEDAFARLVTLDPSGIDGALEAMLGRLGDFLGSDRAYIIRFDHGTETTSMTHEWCREGVEPSIQWEQDLDFGVASRLQDRLDRLEVSVVHDVDALPPDWDDEREYLRSQNITSILEVPFTLDGRLSGVVGFDWVDRAGTWEDGDIAVLRAVAALTERTLSRSISGEELRETLDQLREASAELHRSERRYRQLVETLPDAVLRIDRDGRVRLANPAALRFRERLLAMGFESVNDWPHLPPAPARDFTSVAMRAAADGRAGRLTMHLEGLGDELWADVTIVPEDGDPTDPTLLVVFREVTTEHRHRRELEYRAAHDDLTGLANRATFLTRLEEVCGRVAADPDGRVAVLFVDLDGFKLVNDSLGHDAGDRLLQELATRLGTRLRPGDLLARIGGDELTVLLDGADERVARTVAEAVRDTIAAPVVLGGVPQRVTASVGIALSDGAATPSDLLLWADAAVYRAKAEGGDRWVLFDDDLRREVTDRRYLDRGLRGAVERDEIVVYFQPEVDLATGTVLGAEALARWNHPELGLLAAGRFITVAEENGTVLPLGRHVLQVACGEVARWIAGGRVPSDFVLRVNLSPRQLGDPLLVPHLRSTLSASGLSPANLCLELTETAVMRDTVAGPALLEAIRHLGVHLAIDDFGTGYSSLSLLKRLPIDVVKIDHSFVDGLPRDGEDLAIVRAVMGLASSLHLEVTAEGVERPEQAACLLGEGCRRGQGYLYSPPVPAAEFLTVCRRHGFAVAG